MAMGFFGRTVSGSWSAVTDGQILARSPIKAPTQLWACLSRIPTRLAQKAIILYLICLVKCVKTGALSSPAKQELRTLVLDILRYLSILSGYANFQIAFVTLFRALMGDLDFDAMEEQAGRVIARGLKWP